MNTYSHSVGKDILSYCTKCKLTLSHLIVSMLDNVSVAKVKCNTCKSVHKYKDPSATKTTTKKSPSMLQLRKSAHSSANLWEDTMKGSDRPHKPYSTKEKFIHGDIIDHPKFGTGVVNGFIDQDKIKVVFQRDEKTLLHNKP